MPTKIIVETDEEDRETEIVLNISNLLMNMALKEDAEIYYRNGSGDNVLTVKHYGNEVVESREETDSDESGTLL